MPVKLKIFVHPNWEFWEHLLHTQKSWKFLCIQIENFGHFLHTETVLVKRLGIYRTKASKILHQKAFSVFKGNRSLPYWSKNLKKSLKGTFLENKIALPQKTKAFFSPLSKRGGFRELKKKGNFEWIKTLPQFPFDLPKNSLSQY